MSPISRSLVASLFLSFFASCGDPADAPVAPATDGGAATTPQYTYFRDYLFLGRADDVPLAAPFSFFTRDGEVEFERGVRGWLARGDTWDRFIETTRSTSPAGGVWRVIPFGDLRLVAGGPTEIEAIRFQRGERRLRLLFEQPISGWNQGGESRFRLIEGTLAIGAEEIDGAILEVLRVERTLEDGWPPGQDYDAIFLASGDSLHLYLAETIGEVEGDTEFAWLRTPAGERAWNTAEIRWREMSSYEEARRDVPRGWTVRVPGVELTGEVTAAGWDALLGPERGGRRAVEIRYTVEGWVELEGTRYDVVGAIRHTQQ